jgi:WsaF, C-terminal domain/WsaF, N-terminal domain
MELVRAAPRPSTHAEFRLNLIVPSVAGAATFGGVQTSIDLFRSVSAGGLRRRIISVEALDGASATSFADFRVVDAADDPDDPSQLVSMAAPSPPDQAPGSPAATIEATGPASPAAPEVGPPSIPVGPRDVFIATFWPTALFALEVRAWQAATFGSVPPAFAYLVQDYEPGFYPRSAQHLLSRSTYDAPESTIAVFNTSLLQRDFHQAGLRFAAEFSFEPRLTPALHDVLAVPAGERTRTIVVYGRPSKPRNGFGLIVDGLRLWRATTPEAGEWRIVSAGEPHVDIDLGGGVVLESLGKLSLDAYAALLRTSAIGVSLMISPHPSYPPLEMSHLGLLVLTNPYGEKDLSTCHPNISSLRSPTALGLAEDLAALCARFEADPTAGDRARPPASAFLDTGPQFPFALELAALLEREASS